MATYLGYYRIDPRFAEELSAWRRGPRTSANPADPLVSLVEHFLDRLPAGCTYLGSYNPVGSGVVFDQGLPSVELIETSNPADLAFISQYFLGFINYQWTPVSSPGRSREERAANMAALAQRVASARP